MYEHYSQSIFNLTCFNRDQNVNTLSLEYLKHLINKFVDCVCRHISGDHFRESTNGNMSAFAG